MALAIKVSIVEINQQRTMRFASTMSVYEACKQVAEKINIGGEDHGFFHPAVNPKEKPYWLRMDRSLGYYELDNGTLLEYKKMHRLLKIRLLDNTVKKILIDDSLSVGGIVEVLGEKLGLGNIEEFSLQSETSEGKWLNSNQTLHEQEVGTEDGVVLKKKFFVSDANVDTDNPAQVHFVYIQSRNSILDGSHPCTQLEGVQFAAMECQINYGNYNPASHTPQFLKGMLKDMLPPQWAKEKGIEKDIATQWKKILGMTELNAKFRYIQLCRSLKTYGITCFNVSEILTDQGKKRLAPILLGITRDSLLKMDPNTKEVLVTFPIKTVRRWAAAPTSFTVDFGEHQDNYLSVHTKEAEGIAQLLAGYVDIILKKRKDTGRIIVKDDTEMANEERLGMPRSRASVSLSSASTWGKNQQGAMAVPYAGALAAQQSTPEVNRLLAIKNGGVGKQQITDLRSAKNAIDDLLNELGSSAAMLKTDPFAVLNFLGVPDGVLSSSMVGQLGQKLAIAATSVGKTSMRLAGMLEEDISQVLPEIDETAARLARELAGVLEAALLHASVDDKGADNTLATAKTLAEAAKMFIIDVMKARDLPTDPGPRDALKLDLDMLQLAECFLRGTGESLLIDHASHALLIETAHALHALTTDIFHAVGSPEVDSMIESAELKKGLKAVATTTQDAALRAVQKIQSYAHTMLMEPTHHKMIVEVLKEMDAAREQMMDTLLECSGTEAADLLMNQYEAIAAGIEQLTVAVSCVCRKSDGAPALAAAAKSVQMATAQLLSATTMASDELLFDNAKDGVKDAMDALTNLVRTSAANTSDKATKQKLLTGIDNMLEAFKQLTEVAALAVKAHNDPLKQEKVMVGSQKLAIAIQQAVGDADRQAAVGDLLAAVKEAAANSSTLISLARASALHTQRVDPKNATTADVFKSCKETAEALGLLMNSLKANSSDNIDDVPATISELVTTSQQAAAPASSLVAVLKVNSSKIGANPKVRSDLRAKAEDVAKSIQALLAAAAQVVETSGIAEIAEAVKQLEGVDSVVDAAINAASSGTLPPTPGLVEENAIELLSHATSGLAPPTLQLVEACRDPSTKQIGPASRACVTSTHQVITASRSLASTFPKGQQLGLLYAAKALVDAMEKLFAAARTSSANPNDPAMGQVLLAASRGVAEARANVLRTAKGAHDPISNECDSAAAAIKKEGEKLNPHLFNSGNFNTFIDQLTTCAKAIQAVSIQLSESIHESGDALTSSCQATAALLPNLVEAINNTAATAPKEEDKEAITKSGEGVTSSLAGLVTAAKVSFLNKGDELAINGLADANKLVDDSLTNLLNTANSARPGQMESEAALDLISKAVAMLELSAEYPPEADNELSKNPEYVKEMVGNAAKSLANKTSQILATSRTNPEKAGQSSLEAAKSISTILSAIKASTPKVEGLNEFTTTAKEIEAVLKSVIENVQKPKVIIKGTKALAPLLSELMNTSKKVASLLTDGASQQKLIKVAQQVHNTRNEFVNHAKAAAVKAPGSDVQLRGSAEELQKSVEKLVSVASKVLPQEAVAPELKAQNELLLSSSKGLALATSQLILASKVVSSRPKDTSVHLKLSNAAKDVSLAIQNLFNATQGLAPDQIKCDEALETISEVMENLDGLALTASVGGLMAESTKTHDTARDELARTGLELGQAVSLMVTSALKKEAAALAKAAGTTGDTIKNMLSAITAAASSTPERATQKQLIALSKSVAESVYALVAACKAAGTSTAEEAQTKLGEASKITSEAIKGLIATLKLGVEGSKDCDEAVASIGAIIKQLDEPAPPANANKTFKQSKDEMAVVAKALAPAIAKLVSVSKSEDDALELGPAARGMSDTMPMLVTAVRSSIAATSSEASKSEIVASGKAVANAARNLIQNAKVVASDRGNQVAYKKLVASQVALNEAVARLGASLATGEMECETAANEVRNLISNLDAAALFAAAGQFEVTDCNDSVEEIQSKLAKSAATLRTKSNDVSDAVKVSMEKLGTACKDMASNLSILIANGKIAAAQTGEIPLQQAVLQATRTVAVTCRSLVLASRDVSAMPDNKSAKIQLKDTTEALEKNVQTLLTEAQNAAQEALKGDKKMNATKAEILRLLDRFEEADNIGNQHATPADVVESAKGVATATAHVISSYNSSQDELLANAKTAVKANALLMANAKGATRLTKDKNQQLNLMESAKRVASATTKLFDALKTSNKNTGIGQKKLNDSSEEMANSISDVISAAGVLPGADKAKFAGDKIEEIAEAELIAAAKAIDEAAAQLRNAMPTRREGEGEKADWTAQEILVGDAILEATRGIAGATAALVRAAGTLQRELSAGEKHIPASAKGKFYRKDSIFTEGLISAAKAVAATTEQLVKAANTVTQGMEGEELVIAAAKGVAAATAQLVSSSRVKAGTENPSQKKLQEAAKGVIGATSELVETAKGISLARDEEQAKKEAEEEARKRGEEASNYSKSIVAEMEQQMRILKLEKELERARNELLSTRKKNYQ